MNLFNELDETMEERVQNFSSPKNNTNADCFFSTADPSKAFSHNIIVNSAMNAESKFQKKELNLVNMKKDKKWSSYLRFGITSLWALLSNRLLGISATKLNYRGVSIGRYAVSEALRHPRAYLNKRTYYIRLFKAIWNCILNVDNFMRIKDKVAACYVNDPGYSNGVYFELAILYNIPFYHNTYPYRLTRFVPTAGTRSKEASIVYPAKVDNKIEIGKQILEKITASTEEIDYMSSVEFQSREFSLSEVDAVVYAHSFTDSQQSYGGDAVFLNMYEWLLHTLDQLKDKKVILKAHPGFFRKDYLAEVVEWDRLIFEEFVKVLSNRPNLTIIDWPMRNNDLLNNLSKECVLISHHGNALLEGAGLGFRCISSNATSWEKYNLFNTWYTKKQYDSLLKNFTPLIQTDPDALHGYVYDVYRSDCSFFHEDSWRNIVEKETGIPASEISKNRSILNSLSENDLDKIISSVSSSISTIHLQGE